MYGRYQIRHTYGFIFLKLTQTSHIKNYNTLILFLMF